MAETKALRVMGGSDVGVEKMAENSYAISVNDRLMNLAKYFLASCGVFSKSRVIFLFGLYGAFLAWSWKKQVSKAVLRCLL